MRKLTDGFRPDDARDVVRIAGALCITLGLATLAIRKDSGIEDSWSNGALAAIWFAAAAIPYAIGIGGHSLVGVDRRWEGVLTVTGTLLLPISLYYLVNAIDETYDERLITGAIFALCAALCVFAWVFAAVRFQLLLGALFSSVAVIALLAKVFSDDIGGGDLNGLRALLLLYAIALVVVAFVVRGRGGPEPEAAFGELLTGAGLAAFVSVALGPLFIFGFGYGVALVLDGSGGGSDVSIQDPIWNVLGLVLGIAFIALGAGRGTRGQVYVGGAMLVGFAVAVGTELGTIENGDNSFVGWPLALLLLGVAGLAYSLLAPRVPPAIGRWYQGGREPLPAPGASTNAATAVQPTEPPPPPPPPPPPS